MVEMSDPKDQVWFITGSSQGLGLALTRYVLQQGHSVIATSRNPSRTPDLVAEVESKGGKWLSLDLTAPDLERRVSQAHDIYGRIDVIVNCAGYALMGAIEDTSMEKVHAQMDANFYGPVRVIRQLLPAMRKRRSGIIVNVSSSQTYVPGPVVAFYGASKAALDAYTDSLRQEVEGFGIKVILVQPGAFRTSFATSGADRIPLSEEYAKEDQPGVRRLAWMDTLPEVAKGSPELGAKIMYEAATGSHDQLQLLIGGNCWTAAKMCSDRLQHVLETQKEIADSADFS